MNKIILTGRLVRDPEMYETSSGDIYTRIRMAVRRNYKNQNGEYDSDFVSVIVFRKTAENILNYLRKGSLILVNGKIKTNSIEDDNGDYKYYTDIIAENVEFLENKETTEKRKNNNTEDEKKKEKENIDISIEEFMKENELL